MKILLSVLLLGSALLLRGEQKDFPSGGFTVDFKDNTSIAAESFGKNLLYNPMLLPAANNPSLQRPEGWGITFTPRNSGKFVAKSSGGRFETSAGNRQGAFLQELPAPVDKNERVLEFAFDYRGEGGKVVGIVYGQDAAGNELRISGNSYSREPQKNFQRGKAVFRLPENCVKLRAALRLYNGKYAEFRNVSLRQMFAKRPAVDAVLFPFAYLDNTYFIGEKSIGQVNFLLQRADGKPLNNGFLHINLPAEVKLLDVAIPHKLISGNGVIKVADSNVYVMLQNNSLKAGQEVSFSYFYTDGKLKSPLRTARLRSVALPDAPQSKFFRSGAMTPFITYFRESKVLAPWIELLKKTGFNSVCHGMTSAHKVTGQLSVPVSAAGVALYHKNNIEVTAHSGALANGYRLCGGKVPPELLFMGRNGPVKEGRYDLICPEVIISKHPFVMDVLKRHADLLKKTGMDAFEPNWEPFIFERKGCFCERCLTAFEKFSGLPRSQAADGNAVWIKFRSQQHGRVVKLIADTLGKSAFVPTIDAKELNGANPAFYALASYKDYAGVLDRMVLWSPYVHYRFFSAYAYSPDMLLCVDQTAKAIRIPEKRYAYPNCVQVTTWMAEPETLAFQYLIYYFNRWHGASAYFFPGGLDMRWFHALADVNKVIVQTENLMQNVKPLPEQQLKILTAIPDKVLLKNYRFALPDGSELLAVGNFWPRGECFFELPQLPAGKVYVDVMLKKRYSSRITQVGALKFRVLHIMEKNSAVRQYPAVVSEKFMQQLKQRRQVGIDKAFEQEMILRNRDLVENNISARKIKKGKSSAELAHGRLAVVMPWGKLNISAVKGGMIEELYFGSRQVLAPGAISGFAHFGRNRSHLPVSKRFFCTRLEYNGNVLEADFERRLQVDEHVQFEGMVLSVAYRIRLDKARVDYTVKLRNSSDGVRGPFELMQKYFFLPGPWKFGAKVLTRQDGETLIKDIPEGVITLDGKNNAVARLSWQKAPAMLNFWNASGAAKPCVEFAEKSRELRPAEEMTFNYTITE